MASGRNDVGVGAGVRGRRELDVMRPVEHGAAWGPPLEMEPSWRWSERSSAIGDAAWRGGSEGEGLPEVHGKGTGSYSVEKVERALGSGAIFPGCELRGKIYSD